MMTCIVTQTWNRQHFTFLSFSIYFLILAVFMLFFLAFSGSTGFSKANFWVLPGEPTGDPHLAVYNVSQNLNSAAADQ